MGLYLRRRLPRAQRDRRPRPALRQRGGDEPALVEISKQVAAGAHAVLLLDGAGYHQEAALELPPNMTLLPLPAYSPELNPAENIWAYLRANKLANTVYESYDEIVAKACEAWMFFANDKERVASIATREWPKVTVYGRWYKDIRPGARM